MQTKGIRKEGQSRLQRDDLDFFLQFPLPCEGSLCGTSGHIFLHLLLSLFQVLFLEHIILSGLCLSVHFNDVLFLFSLTLLKTADSDGAGQIYQLPQQLICLFDTFSPL